MTTAQPRIRIVAAFAAVYLVWGSTYLAIRFAVITIPPMLMGGTRFLVSGIILFLWARFRGSPAPTRLEWRDSTVSGVLLMCVGNGGVAWAEQHVPSGLAALIVAVVPLWMVVLDWLRPHGVRPRTLVMCGVVLGLAGLVVLVGPWTIAGRGGVDTAATAVLMVGSLSWAAGSIFNSRSVRPASSAMATGAQMLGGSVAMFIAAALLGELRGFSVASVSAVSWAGWLYLVTFGSLIGFTAYIYLLATVSPAKASTYAYINPIVAVLLGWAIAGETVTARTALAAAIIVGAVAMISLSKQSTQAVREPSDRRPIRRAP